MSSSSHIDPTRNVWASIRSLGESGIQSGITRSTVYTEYVADNLLDIPVEILAGIHACHVLISFEREELATPCCSLLNRAGIAEADLVYWRGQLRIRIPLLSWKHTPKRIESIITIVRDVATSGTNVSYAAPG